MANWTTPIFDRTQEDVNFAITKIAEWTEAALAGNASEVYDLKGCLNISDLNRIEGNIRYINEKLGEFHYISSVSTRTWDKSGLPTESDIRRILANIEQIIASYCQREGTPSVPNNMATYSDINAIEENLYNLKLLLDAMIGRFQNSGAFQSGAMRSLPVSRVVTDSVADENTAVLGRAVLGRAILGSR